MTEALDPLDLDALIAALIMTTFRTPSGGPVEALDTYRDTLKELKHRKGARAMSFDATALEKSGQS